MLKAVEQRKPAPVRRASPPAPPRARKRIPISHPHDPAEREASRLAPPLARGERVSVVEAIGPRLHRDCLECWTGTCACEQPIFREVEGSDASGRLSSDDMASFHGVPLADDVRAPLEQQLGADLSQVRIDDSPAAAEAARKIHARAFTVGNQIMFSEDAFRPDTLKGLELLAHELVHVAQQANGGGGAIHRDDKDDDYDPDDPDLESKQATAEFMTTQQTYADAWENEAPGLTKASYLRRWVLYTMDGAPQDWADVKAAMDAAEVYEDEYKSIEKLGKAHADLVDEYPDAFPSTWADRLEPHMDLAFHISYAEKDRDEAWSRLQSLTNAMPSTFYPVGLPVPDFDEALHLTKFQLVKSHSFFKHPVAGIADAGKIWLEKKFIVDTRRNWLKYAKKFVSSVRNGTAAVTNESFLKYKMYISAIENPERAVESDITIDQAFAVIPADLQEIDTVMAKIAAWMAFADWFFGWPPVGNDFQRGLALADTRIANTGRIEKLVLGQSWADRWGYSDEAWKRIKKEFKKNLPKMLAETATFIGLQFIPVVNVIADLYTIGSAVIDFIDAAWDTADAMDDVMSSKKVVDLQRHSAELGFKGRANALRVAGDLLAIKASIKSLKMRAAKAHAPTVKAPKVKAPKLSAFEKWKSKLSPETQKFLNEHPSVAGLYEATDASVRELLSLCASFCLPKGTADAGHHARLKALLDRKIISVDKATKKYLHEAPDLDAAIRKLEEMKSPEGARAVIEGKVVGGAADVPGTYRKTIMWGKKPVKAREAWPGHWGQREPQANARVDAYERKINPNNESFFLPDGKGGHVQFENVVGTVVQDGKCVFCSGSSSIYHVADKPWAHPSILTEARRQVDAAARVGYTVEWLVSDQSAITQLDALFQAEGVSIKLRHFPE